ncbi:LTA synthase family protein, partial [bacterium]
MKKLFLPDYVRYLLKIFIIGVITFGVFRFVFLLKYNNLNNIPIVHETLYALFNRGLMFDIKIMASILILPFLGLSILYLVSKKNALIQKIFHIYIMILLVFSVIICLVDIPYFGFYNARMTKTVFNWFPTLDIVINALISTPVYWIYIFLTFLLSYIYIKIINRIYKKTYNETHHSHPILKRTLIFFLFLLSTALGVRGEWKINSHPYVIKDAYFSNNCFVNQLSINPMFSFLDSFRYERTTFFSDIKKAIAIVKKDLNIKNTLRISPLARKVEYKNGPKKYNVILIFLESMSAYQMGVYGNKKNLTPYLDKLTNESLFFTNFYSTGQHTFSGIYSTLIGFPILFGENPMYGANGSSLKYSGLMPILKEHGYYTTFFCTGDAKFDNMKGFLTLNAFDKIYEQKDFGKSKFSNGWGGVYDHVLFNYALNEIDEIYKKDQPFFVSLLTVSAHKWNSIINPPGFIPRSKKQDDIRYEYADWALKKFMDSVKNKEWFNNTIFLLVGDHGQSFSDVKINYPIAMSYHKVPFLIYAPWLFDPKKYDKLGSQLDIFPTLMNILKMSYINNSFGIDLFTQKRKHVYLSSDTLEGCLN